MELLAEDKHISVKCDASAPVLVEGDRARLKQVVVNLLDNAIKYTNERGSVNLCVRERGGEALLEVTDTGIGIPAEALPHVFDRFFRVDQARNRGAGGAGIGLAIVKAICAAHHGSVEAHSQLEVGSTFIVRLPKAKASPSQSK
jgi:two-component system phosphate regulon sensor histidine kinase PhoR